MKSNDRNVILKIGISFLIIFLLYFGLGSLNIPLQFEFKKIDTTYFYKVENQDAIISIEEVKLISDSVDLIKEDSLIIKTKEVKPQVNCFQRL